MSWETGYSHGLKESLHKTPINNKEKKTVTLRKLSDTMTTKFKFNITGNKASQQGISPDLKHWKEKTSLPEYFLSKMYKLSLNHEETAETHIEG